MNGSTRSTVFVGLFVALAGVIFAAAILAVGTCSGLLVGLLCAMKRASVLAVLGVVAGETQCEV